MKLSTPSELELQDVHIVEEGLKSMVKETA